MIIVLNLLDIIPGKEAQYAEYLRRVQPVLDRVGARVVCYGQTKFVHMGNCAQEFCGIIAYESMEALRRFSRDPEFKAIQPLRDGSTRNYVMATIEPFDTMMDAVHYLERRAAERPPA